MFNHQPDSEMRAGQRMTLEELHSTAVELVETNRWKQKEIASKLDISQGHVSSALRNADPAYAKTLCRIVALFSNYTVERTNDFIVKRKEVDGEGA